MENGFLIVHEIHHDDHDIHNMFMRYKREFPDETMKNIKKKIKQFKIKWGCLPLSYFSHQKRIPHRVDKLMDSYNIFDKYI